MALYVSDLQAARAFTSFLSLLNPLFEARRRLGSNRFHQGRDDSHIELFAEAQQDVHLNHIASLYTDSAESMRAFLATRGVKVPDTVKKGRIGNSNFNIVDQTGTVGGVQYQHDSWTLREKR
jgi:hypothetical protein